MKTSIRGVLVASALGAALLAAPAGAQALSCGDFVTKNVTLKADLDCSAGDSGGLVVGSDGVTIDLNGHTIMGAGGAEGYLGIENEGYRKVTIKDGTIRAFQDDVFFYNVVNSRVLNVNLGTDDAGSYNGI